ncbi:amidohydrolase family protein [Rhizobium jaguaris]|uniref:Uncharacterized protein n=1 Tax=Rhizobium jaguaris TaxID=1312183 RepID=A0A387G0K4_9HYPH|nr:amidohydrolase family protein [Rhizobium jaguaris]AYG64078.1 hypothetical protein CCGE525_35300 [Rhizobium jaguaris]
MPPIIIPNAPIVDGSADRAAHLVDVLLTDGRVVEVGERVNAPLGAHVFDAAGHFVMPGLIDCHVHVAAATANLAVNAMLPNTLAALYCKYPRGMLGRGFTAVRDMGGAD